MIFDLTLLWLNAIACALSALRLVTYRRKSTPHSYFAGGLSYVLILAFGTVTIRTLFDVHGPAQWDETIINTALCVAVWSAQGNAVGIFRSKR